MAEEENKKEQNEASAEEKFIDSVISSKSTTIGGIELRPPTLATLAILMRCNNAIVMGTSPSETEVMMHVLTFMYVHSAPRDELHGACITQAMEGKNLTLERKALELGERMDFKSQNDFIKIYEELLAWLAQNMDLQVQPIPDESDKGKRPNPNE